MSPDLLAVDRVDVFYGAVHALQGVSLVVRAGELVCLLGGNASGKSTTMKTVLGLLAPRAGRVLLDGADVTARTTAERIRRGLASVPEARRLFPEMTVEENLLMGSYLRRDRAAVRQDLERLYELFPRLAERRGQLVGSMSGGEQQMVAIGRALMSEPRILLVDEPSVGLAPILVSRTMEMIAEMKARLGLTVLMAEQNFHQAVRIADRGYVIVHGSIAFEGESAAALQDNELVRKVYLGLQGRVASSGWMTAAAGAKHA